MRILILLIALMLSRVCCAQLVQQTKLKPYSIQIGWNKTTVLVFPYEVVSADFGSSAILAEKDKASANVLKLKAGIQDFDQTSMYVITSDGKLYPFSVGYTDFPDESPINMKIKNEVKFLDAQIQGEGLNREEIDNVLDELLNCNASDLAWSKKEGEVRLGLGKVVAKDGWLFFQFSIENHSGLNYQIDQWSFTIEDKRQVKRTAARKIELEPGASRSLNGISSGTRGVLAFAFPVFTISDAKMLTVKVFEVNGDRNPEIKISGKNLLKAEVIHITNQ